MTWSSSPQPVPVNKGSPERSSPPSQLSPGKTGNGNQRRSIGHWSWSQERFRNLRRMVRWNIIRKQQKTVIHSTGLCTRISGAVGRGGIHIQMRRILLAKMKAESYEMTQTSTSHENWRKSYPTRQQINFKNPKSGTEFTHSLVWFINKIKTGQKSHNLS